MNEYRNLKENPSYTDPISGLECCTMCDCSIENNQCLCDICDLKPHIRGANGDKNE